jgi:large subunit ribosomal protein L21e
MFKYIAGIIVLLIISVDYNSVNEVDSMTKRSSGIFVGKTRHLARHHMPSSLRVSETIKRFEIGDKVAIVPKGNFKNIPHPRYRGKIGKVIEVRGSAYVVEIKVFNATRKLVVPALHLDKIKG